ncbi:hypothetical protein [Ottowia testudinis]|uniref:Uncharacterized protein n=1 Tax=Ottowia testudinis TaxID=2816950 RepID=A0A975CH69_9BURK|nr:hypothetical protein [Ottowia testudinis]QTD46135.1 hypothetical protein J1M35_04295 [Ottowia testudinis]
MATNPQTTDFEDTLTAGASDTLASRLNRSDAAAVPVTLISPERLVAVVGVLAMVVLLLASIASVARAQVRKGSEFQFAQQATPAQASSTVYSSRGGAEMVAIAD